MLETQDLRDFSAHSWYKDFQDICLQIKLIEVPLPLLKKFRDNETDINIEEVCTEEFIQCIRNILDNFNYEAFLKSNWHAPMDAKFFSFGNELKVSNLADISLYLSTSNIISSDFTPTHEFPYYLILKPWKNIHPASEFRCIVVNNILRGITPRDWPTYYEHFKEEGPNIIEKLTQFYEKYLHNKFKRNNYTFDVVMCHDSTPYILDFGPLNNKTQLYAFSWKEIFPLLNKDIPEGVPPIFRYLESDVGIMTKTEAMIKIENGLIS